MDVDTLCFVLLHLFISHYVGVLLNFQYLMQSLLYENGKIDSLSLVAPYLATWSTSSIISMCASFEGAIGERNHRQGDEKCIDT